MTLGQLAALFERDRCPILAPKRQRAVRSMLRLLEQHFSRAYVLDDLSQHAIDGYIGARSAGLLKSPRHRTPRDGVSAGTIRNELHLLEAMIRWGQGARVAGKRLITGNPIAGISIPNEKNARRRWPRRLAIALYSRSPTK